MTQVGEVCPRWGGGDWPGYGGSEVKLWIHTWILLGFEPFTSLGWLVADLHDHQKDGHPRNVKFVCQTNKQNKPTFFSKVKNTCTQEKLKRRKKFLKLPRVFLFRNKALWDHPHPFGL